MERMNSRASQQGMTMLELLVVLALAASLVAGLIGFYNAQATSKRNDLAADHAKAVLRASQSYVRTNYATLYANAAGGVVTIPGASLSLGDGLLTTNAYAQVPELRVIRVGNSLEGLVLYRGGQVIKKSSLREIANSIGLPGGYVAEDEPANAVGMMRQWTRALSAYGGSAGVGKVAIGLFVEEMAQAADDYLHRTASDGKPELNTMSTAINMAGNDLNNGGTLRAAAADVGGVSVRDGGLATAALSIGRASFGAVPYAYETIQYQPGMNLRIAQGSTQRLVFDGDGVNKFGGGISSNTNIDALGTVTGNTVSGNVVTANDSYAGNWFRVRGGGGIHWEQFGGGWYMGDSTFIRAYNNKSIYTAGELRGGSVTAEGRLAANDLTLSRIESEGAGCGEIGLAARGADGRLLTCTNGVWRGPGGIRTSVVTGALSQCSGSAYATCPAGSLVVGGGWNWINHCGGNEQYLFPSINRPNGNGWEARLQQAQAIAYAVCAY